MHLASVTLTIDEAGEVVLSAAVPAHYAEAMVTALQDVIDLLKDDDHTEWEDIGQQQVH